MLASAALVTGGVSFGIALPAQAAENVGDLTVTVVNDLNRNGVRNGSDTPISGVTVIATDAKGQTSSAATGATGRATIDTSGLDGGTYRVSVSNPGTNIYTEATISDQANAFDPAVSFVDVSNDVDVDLTVGFVDYTELGADKGTIYSAIQDNAYQESSKNETRGIYSLPMSLDAEPTPLTTRAKIGNVYGIGVDSRTHVVYAGAFAKRGTSYGPGGPGAIYSVDAGDPNLDPNADVPVWATVANAGSTPHKLDVENDFDFRTAVSRESLGDVEVSANSKWVTTVNLHTKQLVSFPINEDGTAGAEVDSEIPQPSDCTADWTRSRSTSSGTARSSSAPPAATRCRPTC